MLGGKNRYQPLGYTILEVMIVLAVSGMMFLIATTFVNGKQEKTSFTAGVNEMASLVQDVVAQVSNGQYGDVPLKCNYNPNTNTTNVVPASGSTQAQGTSSDCVFLGKVFRFTTGSSSYEVVSLAGGRLDAINLPSGTLSSGTSSAIALEDPEAITDLTTTQNTPQNLTVYAISATDSGGTTTQTTSPPPFLYFGFMQGLGAASGYSFQSGAQSLALIDVNANKDKFISKSTVNYAQKITICLTDGTQKAALDLGVGNNSQLSVNIRRPAGLPCP